MVRGARAQAKAAWWTGWLVSSLAGCGAGSSAADGAAEHAQAPRAIELVPTSDAVLAACADELDRTYCADADALAAANACAAKLTSTERASCDPERGCVVAYEATRQGACTPGPTYPSVAQCAAPVEDDCAFYAACLEAAHPCGGSGYALGFGEPLCYRFIDRRDRFTPAGQAWLRGVRTCLQRALAPLVSEPVASCDALADAAFASHTRCYTEPDGSFCSLASADVLALTGLLFPYLGDPRVKAQIAAVSAVCADAGP